MRRILSKQNGGLSYGKDECRGVGGEKQVDSFGAVFFLRRFGDSQILRGQGRNGGFIFVYGRAFRSRRYRGFYRATL